MPLPGFTHPCRRRVALAVVGGQTGEFTQQQYSWVWRRLCRGRAGETPTVRGMRAARKVELEAAAMLRRLLEAVERGDLEAGGPKGVGLVHQLEGAAVALEVGPTGAGAETAALLRRLVTAVEGEELVPGGRAALVRRMEGAAVALEAGA